MRPYGSPGDDGPRGSARRARAGDSGSNGGGGGNGHGGEPGGDGRRVLVTGATGAVGRMLCHALYHDPRVELIWALGRDEVPYYFADLDPRRFAYRQVDLLKPRQLGNLFLSEAFRRAGVEVVVHLDFLRRAGRHRDEDFLAEIEGVKAFLDRCLEVPSVRRFVFLSGSLVYKLRAWNSVYIDEDADLNFDPHADPWTKARVDADMICRARMDSGRVDVIVLRPGPIVGRNISGHLNDLLSGRLVFLPIGYDPMVRPLHAWDLVRAFQHVVHHPARGVFNIAGKDVAPISEFVRLAGHDAVPLPTPLVRFANRLRRAVGLTSLDLSSSPDWLRWPCVLDTRKAERVLGFAPEHHIKFGD